MNKILIIIEDPATSSVGPVVFSKKITCESAIPFAVQEFFIQEDLSEIIEEIVYTLKRDNFYWFDERYCLQIIDLAD